MEFSPVFFFGIVVLGILHWVLVYMLLDDLADRKKVLGGRKVFWAIAIISVAYAGSILYLLCHPDAFFERRKLDDDDGGR
jgi:hypothetical protein